MGAFSALASVYVVMRAGQRSLYALNYDDCGDLNDSSSDHPRAGVGAATQSGIYCGKAAMIPSGQLTELICVRRYIMFFDGKHLV